MFSVLTRASAQVTQRASALWTASCDEAAESAGQSLDELEKSMEAEEAEKRLDEAKAALYESTHVLNGKDEDMGHRFILGAMWIMTRLCARC